MNAIDDEAQATRLDAPGDLNDHDDGIQTEGESQWFATMCHGPNLTARTAVASDLRPSFGTAVDDLDDTWR